MSTAPGGTSSVSTGDPVLEGELRVERRGAVEIWTIDRERAKNALDFAVIDAVTAACARRADEPGDARVVILTGAGDAFASGGDLRELRAVVTLADAAAFSARGKAMCRAIAQLPLPVIAAVHGAAYGGGAELAVACDLRAVDHSSRIGFRQARMGVTTAWGTLARLVSLVGAGAAARLLYTTLDVDADEASRIGLADARGDSAMAAALTLADAISAVSRTAVAAQKALLRREPDTWTGAMGSADEAERAAFAATWTAPDHAEAMDAFLAKRAPKFS